MSEELEELGPRSDPKMGTCAKCGDPEPLEFLSADDECRLCASFRRLRETLERQGKVHPSLFDR